MNGKTYNYGNIIGNEHRRTKMFDLAKKDDEPIEVERKLKKLIPEERWIKSHHQLIHFGRYFCTARNPQCQNCKISDMCTNKNK